MRLHRQACVPRPGLTCLAARPVAAFCPGRVIWASAAVPVAEIALRVIFSAPPLRGGCSPLVNCPTFHGMTLDLSDIESDALVRLLRRTIDGDRFPTYRTQDSLERVKSWSLSCPKYPFS